MSIKNGKRNAIYFYEIIAIKKPFSVYFHSVNTRNKERVHENVKP